MSDTPKPPSFYEQLREGNAVGLLVYRSFTPQNPGVIIECLGKREVGPGPMGVDFVYKVQWLRGKVHTTLESSARLSNFQQLIDDHKRKYENQSKDAEELKRMFVEVRSLRG